MNKKKPSLLRSLGTTLVVFLVVVVFAYGVQVTNVNFETTRSEDRLTQLKRVIRALVKPDIIEYDTDDIDIEIPFYLPCPEDQDIEIPKPETDQPYLIASVYCASPEETVIIEGFNFAPTSKGPLNFVTLSGVSKQLGNFEVDKEGYFQLEVEIPTRKPIEEAQHIRATARLHVGGPKFTDTAKVTWEKIIETVFMALLATAIGTVVAIPVSFLAARNLMSENKSPLSSVSFSLIGWPAGIYLGLQVASWIRNLLVPITDNSLFSLGGLVIGLILVYLTLRWSLTAGSPEPEQTIRKLSRILVMLLAALFSVAILLFLESLSRSIGKALIELLGPFGFLGNFLYQMGEASTLLIPAVTALGTGAVVGGTLGKMKTRRGQHNIQEVA